VRVSDFAEESTSEGLVFVECLVLGLGASDCSGAGVGVSGVSTIGAGKRGVVARTTKATQTKTRTDLIIMARSLLCYYLPERHR
jgi:hypothetical protein